MTRSGVPSAFLDGFPFEEIDQNIVSKSRSFSMARSLSMFYPNFVIFKSIVPDEFY